MMDELDEPDGRPLSFMRKMYQSPKAEMMEMIYNSVINGEMGALSHEAPADSKIEGLHSVLSFFKEKEEYEKCGKLLKIINKLYDNSKG